MLDSIVPGGQHPPIPPPPLLKIPARGRIVSPRPTRGRIVFTEGDFVASPPTVPNRLFHDETVLLAAFSKPRFPRDDDAPHHGFHPNPPGLVPRVDADVGNPPIGGGMDGWMSVALLSHSSVQLVGHSVFVRHTVDSQAIGGSIPGYPVSPGSVLCAIISRCQKLQVSTMEISLTKPILNEKPIFEQKPNIRAN
jgi:hypothetical protein